MRDTHVSQLANASSLHSVSAQGDAARYYVFLFRNRNVERAATVAHYYSIMFSRSS